MSSPNIYWCQLAEPGHFLAPTCRARLFSGASTLNTWKFRRHSQTANIRRVRNMAAFNWTFSLWSRWRRESNKSSVQMYRSKYSNMSLVDQTRELSRQGYNCLSDSKARPESDFARKCQFIKEQIIKFQLEFLVYVLFLSLVVVLVVVARKIIKSHLFNSLYIKVVTIYIKFRAHYTGHKL